MNATGSILSTTEDPNICAPHAITGVDLHATLGAAFFGFAAGAILYGITLRQAYQYYTTTKDGRSRKGIIGLVCLMDTLHLIFAIFLVFNLVLKFIGYCDAGPNVLRSLKGLGSVQVFLILFVQGFYLSQIWRLSKNILLDDRFSRAVHVFVIFIGILALTVGIIFLVELQTITQVTSFTPTFEYVVYLGFGTTALVDCAIAAAMCLILHKSSAGTERSESVLEKIIQYFIGSGLTTSLAAILCICLFVAQPDTLLYLGMDFSVSRLYANSVLAMFNARQGLKETMDKTIEIRLPSGVFFGEQATMSQRASLMSDPFSSGSEETKYYSQCDQFSEYSPSIKGRKEKGSLSSRGYTI